MIESQKGDLPNNDQIKAWLPRADVAAALNPHLLMHLNIEPCHEVTTVQPIELLSPARLDIMAKYVYALLLTLGFRTEWGQHVYREHLRVWNEFREGDGSGKYSYEDFRASFDALLADFAEHGFDDRRGLLPTGWNNVIIDGAHRVAAALAHNVPVKAVQFGMRPREYNYEFFRKCGLGEDILDALALQYCRLDDRVRVAVLFPVTQGRDDEMMKILQESGPILYRKSVTISRIGRENLIKLLYRGESWLGDGMRPTPGLLQHVSQRFVDHKPVKFVFFVGSHEDRNRDAKSRIRALFDLGNDPVHINDIHPQTISIAESVLNENSLHFLNNARIGRFRSFPELFVNFKDWITQEHLDRQRFCIDGSAVLAAYGLRDANDLDYLYAGVPVVHGPSPLVSCHNAELSHYDISLDDLVMDPRNHFYWDGVKFLAIRIIRRMKAVRGGKGGICGSNAQSILYLSGTCV